MGLTGVAWAVGRRIPRRVGDALARVLSAPLALLPLPAVEAWADTVATATGRRPGLRRRRRLLENWLRNTLWSLSLERWSDADVLAVADIPDADVVGLRESLAGPGLVLALPHMGSWDLAGAWCARVGIKVVSVAERLPDGLFERFRDARAAMGMDIYAVDQPDLMRLLARDVADRRVVCLLSDRDLSSRGVAVAWPRGGARLSVPAGAALLARRTGADLRVVSTRFDGARLRIRVSAPVRGDTLEAVLTGMVAGFAAAVEDSPEDWLMLRRAFA